MPDTLSACCSASWRVEGRTTHYYVCEACNKPCDVAAITRLPRNGPKPGQSVEAWLYGKDKNCQKERDAKQWKRGR